jgi:hypothetical protein
MVHLKDSTKELEMVHHVSKMKTMKKIFVFVFLTMFIPSISGVFPSRKAYSRVSFLPFEQKSNDDCLSVPLSFIENRGQQDKDILYYASTSAYQIGFGVNTIYLNIPQGTTQQFMTKKNSIHGHCVVISFQDANICVPKGQNPHLQKSSFFQGKDRSQWH